MPGHSHRNGLAALLLVTLVWGTTFPAQKQLSADLLALEIIALRFFISSLVMLPLLRDLRRSELVWGTSVGSVLFCAFYLQVEGLALTSSNRNAFVTGLNVLFVPLLAYLLGQRLGWQLLLGAVLAVLGLAGLFYEQAPWSWGDTLTLISAFVYAIFVLLFEFSGKAKDSPRPERLAAVQSLTMLVASVLGLALAGPVSWDVLWTRAQPHIGTLLYLGVGAGAVIFWLQAWAQHRVRAVEAAIIYGLEPVFAALAAIWWIDEVLQGRALVGGALIVLGVMISQFKPSTRFRSD